MGVAATIVRGGPVLRAIDEDLEGPFAGQLHDLREQRARQVGSADDERLAGIHRPGCAQHRRVTEPVGDSGRVDRGLAAVVSSTPAAAAVDTGSGQFFNGHCVIVLSVDVG